MRNAKGQFMKGSKSITSFKKGSIPWNKGKPGYSSSKKGTKLSLEARKNMSAAMRIRFSDKIQHPRWKKDRTTLAKRQERNDSAYAEWRRQVWLRDDFKCKIANPDCKGRIEAHHILSWRDYPELRYQVNNGITLCHTHHPIKKKDASELSPYFQSLVAEMK